MYIINFQFKSNRDFKFTPADQIEMEFNIKDENNATQRLKIIDLSNDKISKYEAILGVKSYIFDEYLFNSKNLSTTFSYTFTNRL